MPRFTNLPRFFASALMVTGLASAARADNWDQFRGPNGSGVSTDKNIPLKFGAAENMLWSVKVAGMGHSSPVVWGDRLFLQTSSLDGSQRSLLCFDALTGKELWETSIPGTRVKVRPDSSLASATPVTDGHAVFVPFWNGKDIILAAYDFKGEKLWDRNLGEFVSQHGAGASPILYKDVVIFAMDKDAYRDTAKKTGPIANASVLAAFDKKTGKTVWEAPREAIRACYTPPMLLEKPGAAPELIMTSTSAITSYAPETGHVNWYWTWTFNRDPLRTIATTTRMGDVLLACSGDGSGERFAVAVEMKNQGKDVHPERVWTNAKDFPYVPGPLVKGDYFYFVNDFGFAGCFHAKTGKKVWFERLPDAKFYASPLLIDGRIYAVTEHGDVYVLAAEPKFDVLARSSLGSEVVRATPAVANGRLYIRGQDHLYCIGKK